MQNLKNFESIVVLTGAGISAESGISTFRDANGLWEKHRIEDVATPMAFQRDPELVYRFYNARREQLTSGQIVPNAAHRALAKLQKEYQGEFVLITQNVDDLHERAGSHDVVHMHGELLKIRCLRTGYVYTHRGSLDAKAVCECCTQAGLLRPHIVWFGEMPLYMPIIENVLQACDLFIAIGTSGQVYPAAGFVQLVRSYSRAHTIEVNLDATSVSSSFDEHLIGAAGREVPKLVERLLSM